VAWLEKGELQMLGDPHDVVDAYLDRVRRDKQTDPGALRVLGERYGNREIELTGVEFLDADGQAKSVFEPGQRMTRRSRHESKVQRNDVVLGLSVHLPDG